LGRCFAQLDRQSLQDAKLDDRSDQGQFAADRREQGGSMAWVAKKVCPRTKTWHQPGSISQAHPCIAWWFAF
jgi:hypothetical protein